MRRKSIKYVIFAFITAILLTTQAMAQTDWWPMFQHDSTNTGYSTSPALNEACINWCFKCTSLSSPAVVNDKVYITSLIFPEGLYCLEAETGEVIWSESTNPGIISSPAVADGKVYSGELNGYIDCFDAGTGEPIWSFDTGDQVNSSPTIAYGKVYIGTNLGDIICLDAETGDYIWSYPTGDEVHSSPAVFNGKVYAGSLDKKVYCLDADNGNWIWGYSTSGGVYSSPAVSDTAVYVGSLDGNVYCLNAENGNPFWIYSTGDSIYSSPAIAYGMVYVLTSHGNTYCLDAGEKVWAILFNLTNGTLSSPAVADNLVFMTSSDGYLYGFNAFDGSVVLEKLLSEGSMGGSPAVVDGKVYTTSGYFLYSLNSEPYANDIAVTDLTPSRTNICQGDSITIDVTIENQNDPCTEPVSFNCVVYYDELDTPTPEQLQTFWSMGDINREGYIDTLDIRLLGQAYTSMPGDCNWNPDADLNGDGVIDIHDTHILGSHYGLDMWTYFGLSKQNIIEKRQVFDMSPGDPESSLILSIKWKTTDVSLGTHTLKAYVSHVANEIDTLDNSSSTKTVNIVSSFELTISATEGQTTNPPPGTYQCACNEDFEVEATPDFWFSYWKLDGDSVGTENPYFVFMDDDHSIYAVFKSACGDETTPPVLSLSQNYPNPFNPHTSINFSLPIDSHISIKIYDMMGQLVKVLVNKKMKAGLHETSWDGRNEKGKFVASGVYFCRLEAGRYRDVKKMVLIR